MSEPDETPDVPQDDPRSSVDRLLAPLYEDSSLWGLLVVMALVMATFLASIVLMSLERRPFALAALAGVAWMSFDVSRRSGFRGPTVRMVVGLWVLTGGIAAIGHFGGFF
ncbi:MAG: hypothetical protein QNK05_19070 [Myxococcota bacterium]|nr:hypothetical protein [Myxococcota bacterium]